MRIYKRKLKNLSKKAFQQVFFKNEKVLFPFLGEENFLHSVGWINSVINKKPLDKNGNPLPWVTYSFIAFIEKKLDDVVNLFEFGSGNSTLFYADKVKKVVSVEHEKEWYDYINKIKPGNAILLNELLEYNGSYCRAAASYNEKFDVIVVDGRDRVNCVVQSVKALTDKGVIILDDSEREKYSDSIIFLINNGFKKLDFWGLAPGVYYNKCTSIFYKSNNVLKI